MNGCKPGALPEGRVPARRAWDRRKANPTRSERRRRQLQDTTRHRSRIEGRASSRACCQACWYKSHRQARSPTHCCTASGQTMNPSTETAAGREESAARTMSVEPLGWPLQHFTQTMMSHDPVPLSGFR